MRITYHFTGVCAQADLYTGILQVRSATRSVHILGNCIALKYHLRPSSRCSLWYVLPLFRFFSLILVKAPMYYRNANCAVVVYDITQSTSLEKARNWIRELQRPLVLAKLFNG